MVCVGMEVVSCAVHIHAFFPVHRYFFFCPHNAFVVDRLALGMWVTRYMIR